MIAPHVVFVADAHIVVELGVEPLPRGDVCRLGDGDEPDLARGDRHQVTGCFDQFDRVVDRTRLQAVIRETYGCTGNDCRYDETEQDAEGDGPSAVGSME